MRDRGASINTFPDIKSLSTQDMGNVFGAEKPLKEIVRENQRLIKKSIRELEKEIRSMEGNLKKLEADIKKNAKANQMVNIIHDIIAFNVE